MNIQDIKDKLTELNFDPNEYWVLAGSAMVLYGIRPLTHDIDLGCTSKMADELEKDFSPIILEDGSRKFVINSDIEIFENWIEGSVNRVENFPVVSLDGLIKMKTKLGREKDHRDIALIEEFIKNRGE